MSDHGFASAECEKCGSIYRSPTWRRLRVPFGGVRLYRSDRGIYETAACLCETNSMGNADTFSLRVPHETTPNMVIISDSSMRSEIGLVVRRTPKRLVITIRWKEVIFNAETGISISDKPYRLSDEERKLALCYLKESTPE